MTPLDLAMVIFLASVATVGVGYMIIVIKKDLKDSENKE